MFRKFKIITLTLVAVFTMSAIAAAAAQAQFPAQLTAEAGTTALHGEQVGNVVTTRSGRSLVCKVVTFAGSAANGATEVTLTPTFEQCDVTGLGPMTVTMNGCQYRLTFTADAADTFTARVDLICPAGKQVEKHVYISAANHTANNPTCTYDYTAAANQNVGTIDFTNEAAVPPATPKDWLLAHLNLTGFVSTSTIGSVLVCGSVNDANGALHGTVKFKGTNASGAITGITVSTK